jgi:hypothetical protein
MGYKLRLPRLKEPCDKKPYHDGNEARIAAEVITDCNQRVGIKQPPCNVYYCTVCKAWDVGRVVQ